MEERMEEIRIPENHIRMSQAIHNFRELMKRAEDARELRPSCYGSLLVVYNDRNRPVVEISKEDFLMVIDAAEKYSGFYYLGETL